MDHSQHNCNVNFIWSIFANETAHGYFSVDLEIVWRTVQRDLPELERQVLRLKQDDDR